MGSEDGDMTIETSINVFNWAKTVAVVVAAGLYAMLFYELRLDGVLREISPLPPVIDITIAVVLWMAVLLVVAYKKN